MGYWSFALVNGKLAEISFEDRRGKMVIQGHCYVHPSEYTTKKEHQWIRDDTAKYKFTWRNKKYMRILPNGEKVEQKYAPFTR